MKEFARWRSLRAFARHSEATTFAGGPLSLCPGIDALWLPADGTSRLGCSVASHPRTGQWNAFYGSSAPVVSIKF
jgi:hypothetical protein